MKSLELLRALPASELAEVDELIKQQKRTSLQALYTALKKYIKREGEPGNEALFKKVFGKTYTSDKNYLLRNELRLLNEIVYDVLIQQTFKEYIKKNRSTYYYWLARSFFDRKLNSAFEADIDRFIAYGSESIKPEDTAMLLDIKSLWMITHQEKTPSNLRHQIDATDNWKEEQMRHFRYRLREIEARHAYINKTLASIEGWGERPEDFRTPPLTMLDITNGEDTFEEYLILKKHSYQTKARTRIAVLEQMLAIEEGKGYTGEYTPFHAQIASLNAIAVELILLGDFDKADEYMLEAIRRCEANNQAITSNNLQNYIANQLNQKQYQRGIDFYNKYNLIIATTRQVSHIKIYKAYCHLFLHQADEALASLPENAQHTEHQNLMQRMVYVIAFIIRKDYELAANECKNAGRMIKANQGERFRIYEWINNLLGVYANALSKSRNERKKEIQKLQKELLADERYPSLVITEFALRWLAIEIEQQLS